MLQKIITGMRKWWKPVKGDSGSAMLFVLVVAVIGNILIGSVLLTSRYSTRSSVVRREKVTLINIAEAGKEHFYAKLLYEGYIPKKDTEEVVFDKHPFGRGYYTVRCSTGNTIDTMMLKVTGEEDDLASIIEVLVTKQRTVPITNVSARVRGVITAAYDVKLTGSINVDGRNYDSIGNPMPYPARGGTSGVYTGGEVTLQSAAATVGGNDIEPVDKKTFDDERAKICDEHMTIGPNMNSPEAVLGIPEGSLDAFKTSLDDVPAHFKGIVYLTEDVNHMDLTDCSGVLIVHNSTKDAKLHINQGNFKGIIICDVMNKINGTMDVLGAVMALGNTEENWFGNGTGNVRYSSQVLDNIDGYCTNLKWKIEELSWRELPSVVQPD